MNTLDKYLLSSYIILTISLLLVIIFFSVKKSNENFQNQIYKSKCNGLFGCCGQNEDPYALIGGIAPGTGYQYSAYIRPNCCMCRNKDSRYCNLEKELQYDLNRTEDESIGIIGV